MEAFLTNELGHVGLGLGFYVTFACLFLTVATLFVSRFSFFCMYFLFCCVFGCQLIAWKDPSLLDHIRVMLLVWRLRGNIIRTALSWIVWHNVHSLEHTYVSSSYRSNRLCLSHCGPYTVRRGSCLELYYYNMVESFWLDSSLISTTNWFPSVLWHCWFGHLACENCPRNDL